MKKQDLINDLSSALALSPHELVTLIAKAPHSYKSYKINKKSGGQRVISQPARQTKYIQNALIETVLKDLPIHSCASAYKKGASIKNNASSHKNNSYLSKFDLTNFFGSITSSDLIKHFTRHLSASVQPEYFKIIARCCCVAYKGAPELVLSIGAPSSPLLSNSMMFEFDGIMQAWCEENKITYTRYADDLTFSTNIKDISFKIENKILDIIGGLDYPRLTLNRKKTIHASKKNQRRITGLVITNDGKVSLGRDRKRKISVMIHKFSEGKLPQEEIPYLQGLLGLAEDVEPIFSSRMRAKYGIIVLSELFQFRSPPKEIKK